MFKRYFLETTILFSITFGAAIGLLLFAQLADAGGLCENCHEGEYKTELPVTHISVGVQGSELILLVQAIMSEVQNSEFLDAVHMSNSVTCGDCHGQSIEMFAEIPNETCFTCHGDYQELAQLTENPDFEDLNPHKSHLGEIDCTVCHHAHERSVSYCLQCHFEFTMDIPGD